MEEKKERIKTWMLVAMGTTALSIDGFNALLNLVVIGEVLSSIISVAATLAFTIWFWMLGVSFVKSPKKLAAMGGQAIIGLIPVLNTLPELTVGVLATALMTMAEDKGGIIGKAAGVAQGKIGNAK